MIVGAAANQRIALPVAKPWGRRALPQAVVGLKGLATPDGVGSSVGLAGCHLPSLCDKEEGQETTDCGLHCLRRPTGRQMRKSNIVETVVIPAIRIKIGAMIEIEVVTSMPRSIHHERLSGVHPIRQK